MYKDYRYINAGENEIYRWGHKAREKVESFLEPNENGFFAIPVDGGNYWTIGTSKGKYGEFAKFDETLFSVNDAGFAWAKAGTEKADVFVKMIKRMIEDMHTLASAKNIDESEE
jgi:hypothetical protein